MDLQHIRDRLNQSPSAQAGPERSPAHTPARPPTAAGNLAVQRALRSENAAPPVLFGQDMSSSPPKTYLSVAAPGYTLAEVAAYLYGDPAAAGRLRGLNPGAPDRLPPGYVLLPDAGSLSDRANADFEAARTSGAILRTRGVPAQARGELRLYSFSGGGRGFTLTEGQYHAMLRGTMVWLGRRASSYADMLQGQLEVRDDHVSGSNSLVRGISDWLGEVELPERSLWSQPRDEARSIIAELIGLTIPTGDALVDTARRAAELQRAGGLDQRAREGHILDRAMTAATQRSLAAQLGRLERVARGLDRAEQAWRAYITGTIGGAEVAVRRLELTRNFFFGVAAGLAGAVAAPVIFAAAGGGLLGSTLAVGGGALAGAGTSAELEFTGALGGEGLAMAITPGEQRLDWGYVGERTGAGARSGALQGGLGAAGALAAPGVANVISNRLYGVGAAQLTSTGSRLAVNSLTGMALGAPSGAVGAGIENLPALVRDELNFGDYAGSVGLGGALGFVLGGVFGLLPIGGLYKTGGNRLNPFSGTPFTPRWMFAGPFSPLQADWSPPPGFNNLAFNELPPLRPGYGWTRLNGVWEPIALSGRFRDPITLRWYGPDAAGRANYNLLSGRQLLGSRAFTRPRGGTYQGGRNYPMQPADYIEQGGTRQYIRGHNVDYADTIDAPGAQNSNIDPLDYTPEPAWWGLHPRRLIVARARANNGQYRQFNLHNQANLRVTRDGTPIPDAVIFVEYNAAGVPTNAWRIPFGLTTGLGTIAGLAPFQVPLSSLPPVLQGSSPALGMLSLGGSAVAVVRADD
jgi:hypothetical protein